MAVKLEPARGEDVVVRVPKGASKCVKVLEVDSREMGHDISIQVSRERRPEVSAVIGVIVK